MSYPDNASYRLQTGIGYAVRKYEECRIILYGTPAEFKPLRLVSDSWQLIGAPYESRNIEDIKGSCSLEDVALFRVDKDGLSVSYTPTDLLEPGKAYWIHSTNECMLAEPGSVPPEQMCGELYPGECSDDKPMYCESGELVERCSICGCEVGYFCLESEKCEEAHLELEYFNITPNEGSLNTVFSVKVKINNTAPIKKATMSVYNKDGGVVETKQLYDDGAHNDGGENDGVLGNIINPRSMESYEPGRYTIKIHIKDAAQNLIEEEATFSIVDYGEGCEVIYHNAPSESALDIVFLGDDFTDMDEFREATQEAADYILSFEPFKSKAEKINIFRVMPNRDLGCYRLPGVERDRVIICSYGKAEEEASRCFNFDRGIILQRTDKYGGSGQGIWGRFCVSYKGYDPDYSAERWKGVIVHEFGHTLGLMDEYIVKEYLSFPIEYSDPTDWCKKWAFCYVPPFIETLPTGWNCTMDSTCRAWRENLDGIDCVAGCTYPDWYRPVRRNSMMLDVKGGFSPPAIKILEAAIDYLAGERNE